MKKVLVSGYIGFNNFGDEAIFYALTNHLKGLGFGVCALCPNPEEIKEKYDIKGYKYKNFFEIVNAVFSCDVLYSGGGSLLQNKTSNFSLYYYLFIIFLAKLFFKKVIIFSQGIEPIKGKFHEFMTKIILKMVDYITVRDFNSLNYLKSLNIKADLTSDPVYSLADDFKIEQNKTGLIVQLRDFKGFNPDILDDLAKILKDFPDEIKVLSLQNEADEDLCRNFVYKLTSLGAKARFVPFYKIERTFDIINSAKYVISTRLHGLIVSTALSSRSFALVYDDKVKSLSEELNIPSVDLRDYSVVELDLKLKKFFNNEYETLPYRKYDWSLTDLKLLKRK